MKKDLKRLFLLFLAFVLLLFGSCAVSLPEKNPDVNVPEGCFDISGADISRYFSSFDRFTRSEISLESGEKDVYFFLDKKENDSAATVSFTENEEGFTKTVSYNFSKKTLENGREKDLKYGLDTVFRLFGDVLSDGVWADIKAVSKTQNAVGNFGKDYDGYENREKGISLIYADLGEYLQIDFIPYLSVLPFSGKAYGFDTAEKFGKNLVLVNRANPLPDSYTVDLVTLENGLRLSKEAYFHLEEMLFAAKDEGIFLSVRSAYRTKAEQEEIYGNKKDAYLAEGHSEKAAERLARGWVSLPGESEHETGLAVDINPEKGDASFAYEWLQKNCAEYGFILRYPSDKNALTGINYEPWHFRYVGKNAAKEIYENGLVLEEYIDILSSGM